MSIPRALSASASLQSAASMLLLKQLLKKPYSFIDDNGKVQLSTYEIQQDETTPSIELLSSDKKREAPEMFTVLSSLVNSIDNFHAPGINNTGVNSLGVNNPEMGEKVDNNKNMNSMYINTLSCDLSNAADRLLGCLSNTKGLRESLHSLTNEENFTSMALKDFHEKPAFSL
jgi:hypothetical protein